MKALLVGIFLLLITLQTLAQDDCPVLEQAATTETRIWCSDLESGQVCYGNSPLSVDVEGFSVPGDRLSVFDLTSLSGMREIGFGIAVIQTTSYSAGSWQPVDLTAVLLGEVELNEQSSEGRVVPVVTTAITDPQGANVRTGPSTDFRVLVSLFAGDVLKITGVNAAGDWLRVQLPDGQPGWVIRDAFQLETLALPVVTREDAAPALLYAPFTDIELSTASQDARCAGSPESGLLMQIPSDQSARLRVNGIEIDLQGTVFLQTPPDQLLTVYAIEGGIQIADTEVISGYQISFPLQTDLPPVVSAYDLNRLAPLPTEILPRYTYIGIDLATIITPAPAGDVNPIASVLVTDRCVITTGPGGSNLRGGPGTEFPVRGVLALRETAYPISRASGTDGQVWWELAQNVWVSANTTVTGGDCVTVPQAQRIPALPPANE